MQYFFGYYILHLISESYIDSKMQIHIALVLAILSLISGVNSQSAVSTVLAGGGFAFNSYTCGTGYASVSAQMWSNSSVQLVVMFPDYGSSCATLNETSIQKLTQGPSILMMYSACAAVPTSFCAGFTNLGSNWVASFTYQLVITCPSVCFRNDPSFIDLTGGKSEIPKSVTKVQEVVVSAADNNEQNNAINQISPAATLIIALVFTSIWH